MIIEITIEINMTSEFNVFTHSDWSKHIELNLDLHIHTYLRLIVDLSVFLSELRAQMYKMIDDIIASESLSVSKIKLIS